MSPPDRPEPPLFGRPNLSAPASLLPSATRKAGRMTCLCPLRDPFALFAPLCARGARARSRVREGHEDLRPHRGGGNATSQDLACLATADRAFRFGDCNPSPKPRFPNASPHGVILPSE